MTMSKVQFAALMLLTASAVGVGVGWLPHWLLRSKKDTRPQVTVSPVIIPPAPLANDEMKTLIVALLSEREAEAHSREIKVLAAAEVKEPVRYQGKPASEWLALFRDRDSGTRGTAIEPLCAIAEVDRFVIPALIDGLKDKDSSIQKKIAENLGELNPPARETVPLLLQSDVALTTVLPLLRKIDPKGEVAIPLARTTLEDKKLGVRAGCILLAYDKNASLPIPLLVRALEENDDAIYSENAEGDPLLCSQKVLAAWHLRRLGQEVPSAVPGLVQALAFSVQPDLQSPFSALNMNNKADWFAATLTSVDPEGKQAIPLLLKMLGERKYEQEARRNAARALGHYGAKAKPVAVDLRELLKNKEALQPAPNTAAVWTNSALATTDSVPSDPTQPLQQEITEALNKIEPPKDTKQPPLAESSKPATKIKRD